MFDFPANPATGTVVQGPGGAYYTYDGTKWVVKTTTPTGLGCYMGDTPPASPVAGEFWFDTAGVMLYIYEWDGNTYQWVAAANAQGVPPANTLPLQDGTASIGVSGNYARQDHVHPVYPPPGDVGRNYLHNALMNINQRNSGPYTTTGIYSLDRWVTYAQTGDTISFTQQPLADADRAQIGDEAAVNTIQCVFTGGAAGQVGIGQKIESVRRLGNKTVIFSLWAKASSGTPKLAFQINQTFGTGGSPSAGVLTNFGPTAALSTTWTRYSFVVTIPSTAGKTLGTAGNDSTVLWIIYSDGSGGTGTGIGAQSGTVQIWGTMLEVPLPGAPLVPTSVEKLDPRNDLANCQRFFLPTQIWTLGGAGVSGVNMFFPVTLPVTMRAAPTVTISASGGTGWSSAVANAVSPATWLINVMGSASSWIVSFNWSASADL
jgi:hypothetical protein